MGNDATLNFSRRPCGSLLQTWRVPKLPRGSAQCCLFEERTQGNSSTQELLLGCGAAYLRHNVRAETRRSDGGGCSFQNYTLMLGSIIAPSVAAALIQAHVHNCRLRRSAAAAFF